MPACLTHHQFAKKVLETLPDREKINETAFFWGAQGPDFFFCHRYLPWMKGKKLQSYGHRLHSDIKPSETFNAMRDFLTGHGEETYRSYVFGFLCHYALDSIAHPYINALADRLVMQRPYENRTTMHGEVEASLDAIILRRETGKLPSEVSLGSMFPKNEAVQRRIARLFREVIFRVCGEDVSEEKLYEATGDAHLVFSLLTDRTGLKMRIFQALEKGKPSLISSHLVPITENAEVDYANVMQEEWAEGDHRDFFQLFEEAQQLAHRLITQFDGADFAEITGDRVFG